MSIISDEINRVSDEITALRERHRNATYPARGLLMSEIRDLMCERDRLREMNDKSKSLKEQKPTNEARVDRIAKALSERINGLQNQIDRMK